MAIITLTTVRLRKELAAWQTRHYPLDCGLVMKTICGQPQTRERKTMSGSIDELAEILKGTPGEVFIQTHDVPDPDAIAAAHGLRHLLREKGVPAKIIYDREIEKADSRKMVQLFEIELFPITSIKAMDAEDWIVLVDVQRGNTNLRCLLPTLEIAAIDHHELRPDASYRYMDVRPDIGSCSSIIAEYYFKSDLLPPRLVATALLYGIFIDTDNLTRAVSPLDVEMFYLLHPLSDPELIKQIRGNQITLQDLKLYAEAFRTVEVYGPVAFLKLDDANDGLIGASSDIVLSLENVDVAVAYSLRPEGVKLSVRSINRAIPANTFVRTLVESLGFGGGHDHMAGGFIPRENLPSNKNLDTMIKYRAIRCLEGLGY
jgi:nanoRNase/pAp phosphatase (c-di-AMP/oligoRNAs hydrolase)